MQKGSLIVTTKKVQIVRLAILAVSFPFFYFIGIYCLNNPGGLSPAPAALVMNRFPISSALC